MKTLKQTLWVVILFSSLFFISCEKDEEVSNKLVGTDWADNRGMWLFSFKDNTSLNVVYKIPNAPHSYSFENLSYKLDGNNVKISDHKVKSPHGEFYLIKDFKGVISDNKMTCKFLTPTTEIEEGKTMPDLTKLVPANVVMNKK